MKDFSWMILDFEKNFYEANRDQSGSHSIAAMIGLAQHLKLLRTEFEPVDLSVDRSMMHILIVIIKPFLRSI